MQTTTENALFVSLDPLLIPNDPRQSDWRKPNPNQITWGMAKRNQLDEKRIVHSNLPSNGFYHTNYLEYLEICWANHLTPVVMPDIIWFTLMNEVAALVAANPDKVRDLFTTSKEKQEILVPAGNSYVLPLDSVIRALTGKIPSGIDRYIPSFTTTGPSAQFAHYAAFCDMVSPYYNYSMFLCGFPSMLVKGTQCDYDTLYNMWNGLPSELRNLDTSWAATVDQILLEIKCARESGDAAFWNAIFTAEQCGSGHQTSVNGWFASLYREDRVQWPRYAGNHPASAARVNYKLIDTDQTFSMVHGLFASQLDEQNILTPDFHTLVFETTK